MKGSVMKKQLLALAVLALAAGTASAQATDTLAKIKERGTVNLGVRDSSGLAFTLGGGKYVGFHTEMAERIIDDLSKEAGKPLKINYQVITSQNRIPLIQNGTIDFECGSTTNNKARQKDVDFAYTTYVEEVRMAVNTKSGIKSVNDLGGKTVAVTTGTTSVQHIRKTFSEVAPHFTMKRMLDDYYERFYNKLYARTHQMQLSNLADATRLTEWKHKVEHLWNGIEVRRSEIYDTANFALPMGSKFTAAIWLNLNGLQPDELGLELVFFKRFGDNELNIKLRTELVFKKMDDGAALYECAVEPGMAGVYEYGVRMFPRHELLPHRQDFALAKWV